MIPVNLAPLRNNPLGPEKPGPEGKPKPVLGAPARPVTTRKTITPGVRMALPATLRRGGRVKRTGWAKVHKGEKVIPAAAASMGAGKTKIKPRKKKT